MPRRGEATCRGGHRRSCSTPRARAAARSSAQAARASGTPPPRPRRACRRTCTAPATGWRSSSRRRWPARAPARPRRRRAPRQRRRLSACPSRAAILRAEVRPGAGAPSCQVAAAHDRGGVEWRRRDWAEGPGSPLVQVMARSIAHPTVEVTLREEADSVRLFVSGDLDRYKAWALTAAHFVADIVAGWAMAGTAYALTRYASAPGWRLRAAMRSRGPSELSNRVESGATA